MPASPHGGVRPYASYIKPWTIIAAALEPAAMALATEGTCELTSTAAETPGTLV